MKQPITSIIAFLSNAAYNKEEIVINIPYFWPKLSWFENESNQDWHNFIVIKDYEDKHLWNIVQMTINVYQENKLVDFRFHVAFKQISPRQSIFLFFYP